MAQLNAWRVQVADSRQAAVGYFVVVLVGLVLALPWAGSNAVAFAGVFIYSLAALFTWPLADAAFARYASEPKVNAPARSRLPWVWCVLAGVTASIVIGGLGS